MSAPEFQWWSKSDATPTQVLTREGRWSANDETQLVSKIELLPTFEELAHHNNMRLADERPAISTYVARLWHYREFIATYANAKITASYSKSKLGRLWQMLTPVITAGVYYLVFGIVLGTEDDVPNFVAYLCTGVFVFGFTQNAVLAGVKSISGNLGLIRALHFPRASLPIAATLTQLQNLVFSMLVLMAIVVVTGEPITKQWLFLLPALILQALFNVGLVLVVARMGTRSSDLAQVMPFIMRTWMYGSGALYSITVFAENLPPAAARLVELNPMLVYIELVRMALVPSSPLASEPAQLWLLGAGWAVLMFVAGFVYFWRGEREYGRG